MLMRWLDNLMLWQRFLLLGMLGLFLVGPPLYLYVYNTNVAVDFSVVELEGVAPGRIALRLLQQIQQHRGLSAAFLGASQLGSERQAKQAEADATLAALEMQLKGVSKLQPMLAQVRSDWTTLAGGVAKRSISVQQSYEQHTAQCQFMLKLLEALADEYGLSLDPDADTYYLMRSVYFDTATLTEMLGETRAKGASLLATQQIDASGRALMSGLTANAASYDTQMVNTLGKAFAANDTLKGRLGAELDAADSGAKAAIELAKSKVVAADNPSYPAPDYIAFFTKVIDDHFKLIQATVDELDRLVHKRIAQQRDTRNMLVAVVVMIAVLAAFVGWSIARSIGRPIRQALSTAQSIAQGDLSTVVMPGGRSEIGQMLKALADMQASLRDTISTMRNSADAVAHSASAMAATSHEVSLASTSQSESAASMAAAVEQLTVSISHVTNNAGEAQQAASNAESLARDSAKVVQGTAGSIRGVAEALRHSAQMMAELGEQSQRISGIVSVIHEVADQTNLLALNAAIEAARAGEVGRGFAVVADEVRKLAERTNSATQEIGEMIARIQSHTSASVEGVGGAVGMVDGSVQQANQAAEAIDHISASAAAVEAAIDVISAALKEQMSASQQIAVNVERIAQMSEENSASAHHSDDAAQSLMGLAEQMRGAVDRFRLG